MKFGLVSDFQTMLQLWNPLGKGNGTGSLYVKEIKKGQLGSWRNRFQTPGQVAL